jgi:hypothetical protein
VAVPVAVVVIRTVAVIRSVTVTVVGRSLRVHADRITPRTDCSIPRTATAVWSRIQCNDRARPIDSGRYEAQPFCMGLGILIGVIVLGLVLVLVGYVRARRGLERGNDARERALDNDQVRALRNWPGDSGNTGYGSDMSSYGP